MELLVADPEFKQKFNKLLNEMTELTNAAEPQDLASIKVSLIKGSSDQNIEVLTENEFDLNMMYKISGVLGELPYILVNHDLLSDEEVDDHYDLAKKQNRDFIIPSIISTDLKRTNSLNIPYLLFYSRDGRLFMYPVEGSAFSDN